MIIKEYQAEDWDCICRIFDRAKPDEMRGSCDLKAVLPLQNDEKLLQLFHHSKIIVAEIEEKIIGFAGYSGDLISWLFVDPDYYRQGIGGKLLDTVLSYVGEKAYLIVAKNNEAAKNLYLSCGFCILKEFSGKYNGYEAEALLMAYSHRT